ncbi:MAG: hypothetical protein HY259_14810, partial [Chloroflexi bacterium]|nr:hypothetical protein [Chloroflexota bacterium]
ESLQNPTLGLCALRDWIMMLSPAVGQRETASGQANAVTGSLVQGWEAFAEEASPGAVQVVQRVQRDLRPLLRALARAPRTLLHGDYKFGNLGTWRPTPPDSASELHARNDTPRERTKAEDGALRQAQDADATPPPPVEPRTLMLDWGLAGFGAPLLDLAWFLAVNSARLPVSKEDAIEMYHESLASFGYPYQPHAWARDLDVALLAGGVLRLGWAKALGARADDPAVRERESAEVRWWSECAARAGRWLA